MGLDASPGAREAPGHLPRPWEGAITETPWRGGERRFLSSEESPSLGLEPSCASLPRALSYPITACRSEGATLPLSSSVLRRALWISLTPSQAVLLTPEEDREGSPDCGVENRGPEWPWGVDFSPDGQDEQWRLTPGPALCPLWLGTERCGEITCKPHGECDGPRAQWLARKALGLAGPWGFHDGGQRADNRDDSPSRSAPPFLLAQG
ncbi:uncharacterized protein LOC125927341 [Panthera uncia]|uniref:uncharacterized protein LOC125927341 n=1 Tax=Panthera uncia TaxID=29064 RepID=UPI0020FFC9F4|nr:uncharacterized protein LOC125927341 [Panthera uncia]